MTIVRSEVTTESAGDIPRDFAVNVVYHNVTANLAVGDVGWQNHADEVRDVFSNVSPDTSAGTHLLAGRKITVKCYDLADAKPRPVRGMSVYVPATQDPNASVGPRQIALCLSYYAGRNLPSERGRIYIGPLKFTDLAPKPASFVQDAVLAIGKGLFNVGGGNVHWQQHSEKSGVTSTITDIWVDNRWDTIRGRLQRADSRETFHF